MRTKTEATVDDLYRVPEHGKAEIVNGELVLMSPTGGVPGRAAGKIYISLYDYERRMGGGYAFPDNVGFIVERRSLWKENTLIKATRIIFPAQMKLTSGRMGGNGESREKGRHLNRRRSLSWANSIPKKP